MMLNKIVATIPAAFVIGLCACNGAGNPGPAATTQYGQLIVESQQRLGDSASIPGRLYPAMLIAGKYIDAATGQPTEDYESANIINTTATFNFNVTSPLLDRASGYFKATTVSAYSLQYTTPGVNATTNPSDITHTVSGLLIVPNGVVPRGVVLYYHPTTLGKNEVPSCLGELAVGSPTLSSNLPAYCNITALNHIGAGLFAVLSATYAARGFVVIAPDYIGQGADYNSVHPYVAYPENNATTGLNMLPAMRQILASQFNVAQGVKLPLFITGYSEGGGYALKASQMVQSTWKDSIAAQNLQLLMTTPVEGAYSLEDQMNFAFANDADGLFNCNNAPSGYSCGQTDMMKADQSGPTESVAEINIWNVVAASNAALYKPNLTSYVLNAVVYYSLHNLTSAYNQVMNTQFWSKIPMLNSLKKPLGIDSSLPQLFSGIGGTIYTGDQIGSSIFLNTTTINGYDTYESKELTLYFEGESSPITAPANYYGNNNSGLNFINGGARTDPVFLSILINGSTYNWKTSSPINFVHLAYDSAVPVINTNQAYSCMRNGISYPGNSSTTASSAICNPAIASGNLIESTIIQNFQYTNSYTQFSPLDDGEINPVAITKFWTNSIIENLPATPMDHIDIRVLADIIPMCTFENILSNGSNSSVCPAF